MDFLKIIIETLESTLPWALAIVLLFVLLLIYGSTHKNSGFRGVVTYLGHLIVFGLGWLLGKWAGILLISFPILLFYYYLLFHLAMVVVPVATPENWRERWLRFLYFLWYQWGFQYPAFVVTDAAGRNIEQRIRGNPFGKTFAPGLFLASSHQVVGLTRGITFSGIQGPGVVFTNALEFPMGAVDLRTQLRTSWINVVSSDGIPYKALLFTAFAVDKEKWDYISYLRALQKSNLYKGWEEPDYTKGSYPFSKPRLRALFSMIGVNIASDTLQNVVNWDEGVVHQIEQIAREVLSRRRLNELWLTKNNVEEANVFNDIAAEIKEGCSFLLQQRGVRLYTARVVNLDFVEKSIKAKESYEDDIYRFGFG